MFLNKAFITLFRLLVCSLLTLFLSFSATAQYVPGGEMTGTPGPGAYYHTLSLSLKPNFLFTATPGNTFRAFILPQGCTLLGAAPSQDQNYIITYAPRQKGITNPADPGNSNCQVAQSIQYFDGLGRPLQTVQVKASPQGNDVVMPQAYDALGREDKKYLPYVTSTGAAGAYRSDAVSMQASFYQNPTQGVVNIPAGEVPYAQTRFEVSPLNRILEQGAPGLSWQIGGGHTNRVSYSTNTETDAVRMWVINSSGNGAAYASSYAVGMLTKNVVNDGNSNEFIEFIDVQGNLICKKVKLNTNEYLTTDYVYDNLNNLRYVISPLPTKTNAVTTTVVNLPSSFQETDNVCKNYIYIYRYDTQNRPIAKKLPGKDWEYIVYNSLDQPILTQNGTQRATGIWIFAKYDALGRQVITGQYASSASQATLQTQADNFTGRLYEVFDNNTASFGYTHGSFPDYTPIEGSKVLTVNFYDRYQFINNSAVNPNSNVFTTPESGVDTLLQNPIDMMTGKLINVLGTNTYLLSVMHYDKNEQIVKMVTQYHSQGSTSVEKYDIDKNTYSFSGQLVQNMRIHHQSEGHQLMITTGYAYDHMDRKLIAWQRYNNNQVAILSKLEYNELGQPITKHLHSTDPAAAKNSFLQHIDYRYNVRGWLTRINSPSNLADETFSNVTDLFSEQLDYDKPNITYSGTNAMYNGSISSMTWQTKVQVGSGLAQEQKGYVFTYDQINRLTSATYNGQTTGNGKYDETVSYDELGNVMTLTRKSGGNILNALSYNYTSGGVRSNRLSAISDGGTEGYSTMYTYDDNGSVKEDSHKALSNIQYNLLSLPTTVTLNGKTISYTYDASGNKLERRTSQGTNVLEDRSYVSDIEYSGNAVEFIHNEEGRALPLSNGDFALEYKLADHLGNIRVLFGDKNNDGILSANEIAQLSDYYPFGRKINYGIAVVPSPDNKYGYNGKELQQDLEQYDYGVRLYDPVIARWNSLDLLAEQHYDSTPYNYVLNNPSNYIDPIGLDTFSVNNVVKPKPGVRPFDPDKDVLALKPVVIRSTPAPASTPASAAAIYAKVHPDFQYPVARSESVGSANGRPISAEERASRAIMERWSAQIGPANMQDIGSPRTQAGIAQGVIDGYPAAEGIVAGKAIIAAMSIRQATRQSQTIYRVVSELEAADVLKNGFRPAPSGISSYEGKLFWTNIEDAKWYQSWAGQHQPILKIKVNNGFIFENGTDVGRTFYHVSGERLELFNNAIRSTKKINY